MTLLVQMPAQPMQPSWRLPLELGRCCVEQLDVSVMQNWLHSLLGNFLNRSH